MKVSVLTITCGRKTHLTHQLRALTCSLVQPDQCVIVGMNEDVRFDQDEDFTASLPIRCERVDSSSSELPLAKARNHAAFIAQHQGLIFLDVDCIPHPSMIGTFVKTLKQSPDGLWMGSAHYLPAGATRRRYTIDSLDAAAKRHPLQPDLKMGEVRSSDDYEKFWSLCFAVTKNAFDRIGGFDEKFVGYGGEDTDFAFAARKAGVPFGFVGARSYHQHHASCQPPLNHFDAILTNAQQFKRKWGTWPMESWLLQFEQRGLVRRSDDQIKVVRRPEQQEIEEATCQNAVNGT